MSHLPGLKQVCHRRGPGRRQNPNVDLTAGHAAHGDAAAPQRQDREQGLCQRPVRQAH